MTSDQRGKIIWRQSQERLVQLREPAADVGLVLFRSPKKKIIKGHLSNFGLVSRKLNGLFCLLTNYLQVNLSKSNNPVQGTNKTAGSTEKHTSVGLEREKTGGKAAVISVREDKASSRVGDSFLQRGTI